jgi:hypothetical protein
MLKRIHVAQFSQRDLRTGLQSLPNICHQESLVNYNLAKG